jgi:hypothetical protein
MAYQMPSMTQIVEPNIEDKIELLQFAASALVYLVAHRHGWLADTGASQHICNSKPRFTEFHEDKHMPALNGVDGPVRPQGYGKVTLRVMKRSGQARKLTLHNVLYLL